MKTNKFGNNIFFDFRMGLAGALIMGSAVYLINASHGVTSGIVAGLKQSFYTFFVGGFLTRFVETLAVKYQNKTLSLITAVTIPSIITMFLTFILHNIKGTPEPFLSTLPTICTAPFSFLVWAVIRRHRYEH